MFYPRSFCHRFSPSKFWHLCPYTKVIHTHPLPRYLPRKQRLVMSENTFDSENKIIKPCLMPPSILSPNMLNFTGPFDKDRRILRAMDVLAHGSQTWLFILPISRLFATNTTAESQRPCQFVIPQLSHIHNDILTIKSSVVRTRHMAAFTSTFPIRHTIQCNMVKTWTFLLRVHFAEFWQNVQPRSFSVCLLDAEGTWCWNVTERGVCDTDSISRLTCDLSALVVLSANDFQSETGNILLFRS